MDSMELERQRGITIQVSGCISVVEVAYDQCCLFFSRRQLIPHGRTPTSTSLILQVSMFPLSSTDTGRNLRARVRARALTVSLLRPFSMRGMMRLQVMLTSPLKWSGHCEYWMELCSCSVRLVGCRARPSQ